METAAHSLGPLAPFAKPALAAFLLTAPVVLPPFALIVAVAGEALRVGDSRRERGARLLAAALYAVAIGLGCFLLVLSFGPWVDGFGPPVDPPFSGWRYRLPGGPLWHGLVAPFVFLAARRVRAVFLARFGFDPTARYLAIVPIVLAAVLVGALLH